MNEIERKVMDEAELNPQLAYNYLRSFKSNFVSVYSDMVYKSGTPKLNYEFARDIKGADVLKHQKRVVESKDPELNYLFAKNISGVSILPHSKVIKESNDLKYNYLFLRDVMSDLDTPIALSHIALIKESGEPIYIETLDNLIESRRKIKESHISK